MIGKSEYKMGIGEIDVLTNNFCSDKVQTVLIFLFIFFYEWEHRTGTMCPFSGLHPSRKGKER